MKLPIKHKYFMQIKAGTKKVDFRDAHITFVDEGTGEKLRKDIADVWITKKSVLAFPLNKSPLFTDDRVVAFHLEEIK